MLVLSFVPCPSHKSHILPRSRHLPAFHPRPRFGIQIRSCGCTRPRPRRTGHGTAHLSFNIDSTGHSETHSHTHTQTQRDTCDMIVDTCTALFIHLHLAERADPHCHTAQRTPVRVRSSALAALVSFCLDSPACACPFPRATYCFSYSFWLSRFACTAVRAGQRSPERLTTCAAGELA